MHDIFDNKHESSENMKHHNYISSLSERKEDKKFNKIVQYTKFITWENKIQYNSNITNNSEQNKHCNNFPNL